MTAGHDKAELRSTLLERRTLRGAPRRLADGRALAALRLVDPPVLVAAYVGVGTEPPTLPLLESWREHGSRVLLPMVRPAGGLLWGDLPGDPAELVRSRMGLLEPPGLSECTLQAADLVVVPALAVDRRGHRLGRGGGYYDRVLANLDPAVRVLAVTFDDEVLDQVPVEPHDIGVHGVLTPSGLQMFGR